MKLLSKIFGLSLIVMAQQSLAAPTPATGQDTAKSVMCSGAAGSFYVNYPNMTFTTDEDGQTMPNTGAGINVGYQLAGVATYTHFNPDSTSTMLNGPLTILQVSTPDQSFTAFVAVDTTASDAWINATGDMKGYAFDGNQGSMTCQFYQDQIQN